MSDPCDCCGSGANDRCTFKCCGYPNGAIQIILSQTLTLIGLALSAASLVDCEFVKASVADFPQPIPDNLADRLDGSKRGFGFYTFEETPGGSCYWEKYDSDVAEWYFDLLGSGFRVTRALGSIAAVLGLFVWLWMLFFTCVAHPRALRFLAAFFLFVMTAFQASMFASIGSDFCDENDCEMGRSAIFGIVAGSCFFLSGCLLLCSKSYPGATAAVTKKEAAPAALPVEKEAGDNMDEEKGNAKGDNVEGDIEEQGGGEGQEQEEGKAQEQDQDKTPAQEKDIAQSSEEGAESRTESKPFDESEGNMTEGNEEEQPGLNQGIELTEEGKEVLDETSGEVHESKATVQGDPGR